jgi:hypothetical protein
MNRAKQLRIDQGLGVVEAADKAGVHFKSLKKIEDGEEVGARVVRLVGEMYGVQPSSLYLPAVYTGEERDAA